MGGGRGDEGEGGGERPGRKKSGLRISKTFLNVGSGVIVMIVMRRMKIVKLLKDNNVC